MLDSLQKLRDFGEAYRSYMIAARNLLDFINTGRDRLHDDDFSNTGWGHPVGYVHHIERISYVQYIKGNYEVLKLRKHNHVFYGGPSCEFHEL